MVGIIRRHHPMDDRVVIATIVLVAIVNNV